ncbi:MAG TPA: hypothetical protein VG370_02025, partial [Chloroflexota bacterium]|nr:hypothetical protein [Chloroflexota bacterium]
SDRPPPVRRRPQPSRQQDLHQPGALRHTPEYEDIHDLWYYSFWAEHRFGRTAGMRAHGEVGMPTAGFDHPPRPAL